MILRKEYENYSTAFLEQHHDIILQDVFHHIQALLLFPPNCACKNKCRCDEFRSEVVLSMNLDFYHQGQESGDVPEHPSAINLLLQIPEDASFKKHHNQAYPLWLINENFQKKLEENHYKIVDRLIETLLRLGATYETLWRTPSASMNEAFDVILGKYPLKAKALQDNNDHLGGEKTYAKYFNMYKPICHFVAAQEHMKTDKQSFSPNSSEHIEEFLKVAHWFRKNLLRLHTPNVKGNILFSEDSLTPLPSWINSEDISIPIEPYQEKVQEMNEQLQRAYKEKFG